MGLGTALAAGMAAYDTTTNNIKVEERADQTFEENSAIRQEQLSLAKTKAQEYNDPTNIRTRAITAKNNLMIAEGQHQIYKEMEQMYQGSNQQQSNEVQGVKTEVADMKIQVQGQDTFNAIYTDLASTGKVQSLDKVNAFIEAEPAFKNKIGGKLIEYNPTLDSHKNALMAKAAQMAKQQGGEPEDYFPAVENMAKNNIIAFDSTNNKPIDITALGSITGFTKNVTPSIKDKARSNITTAINKATTEYKGMMPKGSNDLSNATGRNTEAISGVTDIAPWHMKEDNKEGPQLWNGKNPNQEIARRSAYGMSIPPDLQATADANADLAKEGKTGYWAGASQEEVMQGLDNIMMQIESGKPITKQMVARAKTGAGALETADMKNDYLKELDAAVGNAKIKDIFNNGTKQGDMNFMESTESDNMNNAGSMSTIAKKREELTTNEGLVSEINGALDEMSKMDGEMLSGHMATAIRNTMVKDPGLIKSIAELRTDDEPAAIAEADKIRKQVYNSLKMNTKVGIMLAKYIKSVSGAAVSDQEREFLVGIMQGAVDANPKAMAQALETFRDSMIDASVKTSNDFFWQKMLPATSYKNKDLGEAKTDYSSSIPEGVAFTKETLDKAFGGDTGQPGFFSKLGTSIKDKFSHGTASQPANTGGSTGGNSGSWATPYVD